LVGVEKGLAAAADNIPVGLDPWDIVMLPGRPGVYVVNYGAHVFDVVSVLDTAPHQHVMDLDFPFDIVTSAHSVEIGLTPDGKRAWLVHDPEHHICKIDTASDEARVEESVINACTEARKLNFSPDGRFAYLVDLMPCPAGGKLYVIVGGAPEVQVYDTRTFQLAGRIPVGSEPAHFELTPDGGCLLVATKTTLFVVDTASDQLVTSIPVCGWKETIEQVVVSPDGSLAYVTFNPQHTGNPDRTAAGIDVIRIPAPLDLDVKRSPESLGLDLKRIPAPLAFDGT
jgi:DNA-binding beta-propeller fold protein YncE